jgi:nitrate reductase NapE
MLPTRAYGVPATRQATTPRVMSNGKWQNSWHTRDARPVRSFDFEAAGRFMLDTSAKHGAEPNRAHETGRRAELFVFAIIAAFIWPVVAVGVVGGYGFLIWMTQLILGPPGPPGG